jgi:hypothetical protein
MCVTPLTCDINPDPDGVESQISNFSLSLLLLYEEKSDLAFLKRYYLLNSVGTKDDGLGSGF